MTGALEGVRVVDFGQYIAGPLAAMLLADQGAEVVHVDPPGGPRMHSAANATWNRTKLNVELDLTRQQDREIAQRLVAGADVLIENFRPGVMDRLGFGAEAMATANPRLVYCSLPGFAADDPRAAVPAWEGVVTAAAGGYPPPHGSASDRPVYTAIPTASNFAAYIAATAITMALIARGQDGPGQRIEVPLFDAMFTAIGAHGLLVDGRPAGTGAGIGIGSGIYQCADGRWVQFNTQNPRFLAWFAEAAGVGLATRGLLDRDRLAADPALCDELRRRLTALFQTRAALDWEDLINTAGGRRSPSAAPRPSGWRRRTPASPALSWRSMTRCSVRCCSPVRRCGSPAPPALSTPAAPPCWWTCPFGLAMGSALAAGASAALAGVRVLDLTQVLAGPMAARTLAEFGADVIKINDPLDVAYSGGERLPLPPSMLNRGKRTMLLDLRTPAGLEVFWRLVDGADVVLQNFRHGVAERMGIGYEQVRAAPRTSFTPRSAPTAMKDPGATGAATSPRGRPSPACRRASVATASRSARRSP
ncbi:MAG: CoA transferase [Dehalococcoidia bacterium]